MKITEDGYTLLDTQANSVSIIYVSGSLGGGTATLGYYDDTGFVALTEGALTIGSQTEVRHGSGMQLFVHLTGAVTPSLIVLRKGIA